MCRDRPLLSCLGGWKAHLRALRRKRLFIGRARGNGRRLVCRGLCVRGGDQTSASSKPRSSRATQASPLLPGFLGAREPGQDQHHAALWVAVLLLKLLPCSDGV